MTDIEQLRQHFLDRGIIFGDTVQNTRYGFFIDSRQALQDSGCLGIAGRLLWKAICHYQPEVIVGKGLGAINLLVAVQIAAEAEGFHLQTLIVRDERKKRNRQRLVEGPRPRKYARAIFIDDVINYGNTFQKCRQKLYEEEIFLDIIALAVLYDFWRPSGSRRLELLGLPVHRIFTRHDLGLTRIDPKKRPVEESLLWRNLAYNQWPYWYKSPPTICNSKVFWANDRHEVYCHDIESGALIWMWQGPLPKREKGIVSQIQYHQNKIYFGSYDGSSYCLDADTGVLVWANRLDLFIHSTPWINSKDGEIYISTERGTDYKKGDIVCQDLNTGETKWRFPTRNVVPASPLEFKGQVICGSNDGYLYSISNGKLNWSIYLGVIKGRPAIMGDKIIVVSEDGKIIAVSLDGQVLWHRTCGISSLHQFPQVYKEKLVYVINQEGYVIAYSDKGQQIWIRQVRGQGLYNIILRDNEIFVITENGYAVFLDAETGLKISQTFFNMKIRCPADFNKDFLVIHSLKQGLFSYKRAKYDKIDFRCSVQ